MHGPWRLSGRERVSENEGEPGRFVGHSSDRRRAGCQKPRQLLRPAKWRNTRPSDRDSAPAAGGDGRSENWGGGRSDASHPTDHERGCRSAPVYFPASTRKAGGSPAKPAEGAGGSRHVALFFSQPDDCLRLMAAEQLERRPSAELLGRVQKPERGTGGREVEVSKNLAQSRENAVRRIGFKLPEGEIPPTSVLQRNQATVSPQPLEVLTRATGPSRRLCDIYTLSQDRLAKRLGLGFRKGQGICSFGSAQRTIDLIPRIGRWFSQSFYDLPYRSHDQVLPSRG